MSSSPLDLNEVLDGEKENGMDDDDEDYSEEESDTPVNPPAAAAAATTSKRFHNPGMSWAEGGR